MTDEELDAVLMVLDYSKDAELPIPGSNAFFKVEELVGYFSALRAQIAEAQKGRDVAEACNRGLVRLNEATQSRADRAEAALAATMKDKRWIMEERDRTFALMLNRAERAEAEVQDVKKSLTTAEAALAAQIEADAVIADEFHRNAIEWAKKVRWFENHIDETDSSRIAAAIRNQPHDRTALDRMLAEAREKALREAADELRGYGYSMAIHSILALIEVNT